MRYLYELAIRLFTLGIHAAAVFHPKARHWVDGRKHLPQRLPPQTGGGGCLWLHAASLGEFEQGRPILEAFRNQYPDWKIVLTFFSPSGYELRKDYPHADLVCYLPADTRRNARDFLDRIQPDLAIFVKYEFWANYLFELRKRGVPTLLVSALFRPSQPFFRWWGRLWREMLRCYTHIFVQDKASAQWLAPLLHPAPSEGRAGGLSVAGDTRVDRVLRIAETAPENPVIERFLANAPGSFVLIAGSTWEPDERLIFEVISRFPQVKLIVAPHDPSPENVERICRMAGNALRYSQEKNAVHPPASVLVIDNVGLLNQIYRYGTAAYIGGGFGRGIHNTLEPGAFGLPVIFGPKYHKFEEARQFLARGGAFAIQQAQDLENALQNLQEPNFYQKASNAVRNYLEESRGATTQVMNHLKTLVRRISPPKPAA